MTDRMMGPRRILERRSSVASDEAARALLQATPRYQTPRGRKERVRMMLVARGPRRSPWLLRPAVALGVFIGFGAIASAALGTWPPGWALSPGSSLKAWAANTYQRVTSRRPAPPAPAPPPRMAREQNPDELPAPNSPPPPAPVALDIAVAGLTAAEAPTVSSVRARPHERASHARRSIAAASSPSPSAGAVASPEDTIPVLAAVRALRREHDPARARALLADYLARRPNGALAEEALALSIEAAVAQHDPAASALAARYLQRYPNGSFRSRGRQALGSTP